MGVSTFRALFLLFYCLVNFVWASKVELKFYGVSNRDANISRRYPIETSKDYYNRNLDYGFTHLITKTDLPQQLDEEKLFCQAVSNDSLKYQNGSQQNLALFDSSGNMYDYYQFGPQSQSFKQNPCSHFKNRLKRQFQPLSPQFNNSNVIVNSLDSNITVTQLINITSGRSMVEVRENVVRVRINSERSNVRINPKENFVNISVVTPFVILNASERQSLDMTAMSSEISVVTQKGGQNYSIITESGPSNMTIRQGTALIEALADTRSKITVQGYLPNVRDQILINSQVIDRTAYTRELVMLALTQNVRTEIQLVRGLLSIIYDKVQIRVSAIDHEILIYTGVYTVRITTLLSPFSISVTDTVDVTVDNATVSIFPDTSNITGKIPYSLMQLRPDNATNVQLSTDQQGSSALSNANIDVESRNLTLEVIPAVPRIYAVSIDSYAIINTSYSNIGLTANRSVIEVLSGSPYIRVLTGNTSIEVRAGGKPFTLSPGTGSGGTAATLFPPIVTNTNGGNNSSAGSQTTTPNSSGNTLTLITGPLISTGSSISAGPTSSTNSSSALNTTTFPTPPPITLLPTNNQTNITPNGTLSSLTTVLSVSPQTPNISGQGEGGSSISPVDQTRIILSSTETASSAQISVSVSSSVSTLQSIISSATISQTGAVSGASISNTTASQSVLNSTSTLPSLFNFTSMSSVSGSLPINPASTESTLFTGSTQGERNRTRNIFPFPFPVIIPWPLPNETTPNSNGSVSAVTTTSGLNTANSETSPSSISTISGVTALPTTGINLNASSPSGAESTTLSTGTVGNTQTGESTTSGSTVFVGSGTGTGAGGFTAANVTGGGTAESVPTPPSFPVDLSTMTSGATVSQSCVTGSLNASGDIVCIEAQIVSIQVPPMNSSSARSADTPLPTSASPVANGTEQFVISQFSLGASSNNPAVTLPLPNTAQNGSVTQPVVLPEPPTFTVSPPILITNVSSVLLNTLEVIQNTLIVLQTTTQITPAVSGNGSVIQGAPILLNAPPNEAYMLSVAVKVKRSTDLTAENFSKIIQNALKKAYVEGRNRQLGISTRRRMKRTKTRKRDIGSLNAPTVKFDENSVEIRLISVDRPMSDEAKIRFYVVSDKNLVEAKRAKETFDQLGNSELSAFLTYPVTEPVQPLPIVESLISSSTQLVATSDNRAIVAILVTVGSLLIILAVLCFILYKVKKHIPKLLSRKNSTSSGESGVFETGVKNARHVQLPEIAVTDSKNINVDKRLLLGDLPPLQSNGPKLIKEYSDRDLSSYDNMSYSELFEYVNTSDQPVNVAHRMLSPRGSKVSPLTPLSPSPVYAKWGTSHAKPPSSSQVTQVVRISPGTRRRLAKHLLDSSFPLANINIDEVITGGKY